MIQKLNSILKNKIIIIILILIFIGIITYHKSWYTYSDGCTRYDSYIYGIKYKTEDCVRR